MSYFTHLKIKVNYDAKENGSIFVHALLAAQIFDISEDTEEPMNI